MGKNRGLMARMRRNRMRGKFKNWTNNPRGGTQAPLRRYSIKNPTTVSKDVEMWHGQTLGARAGAANNTVGIKQHGRLPSASKLDQAFFIPQPSTKNLTFGRVVEQSEGPLPKLLVMWKEKEVHDKKEWYMDVEYDRWVHEFNFVRLIDGRMHKVDIFFSGRIFVIVEIKPHIARRSIIYNSFQTAKRIFEREQVRWAETKQY